MRTVTVEVPEGHMVKIVKEESMQPTQKVTGGGKFEFEGETFIPGDVIINPNRGGGSMMILSEIREERSLSFYRQLKYLSALSPMFLPMMKVTEFCKTHTRSWYRRHEGIP